MNGMKEVIYQRTWKKNIPFFLSGDIGGTNSNFGIISMEDRHPTLLVSLHIKSKEITDFAQTCKRVVDHCKERYGITCYAAVIGGAGVVSEARDYCKPTNLHFEIRALDIMHATDIAHVVIVNDFEIIGYGLDLILPKDVVLVKKGFAREHSNKAILGAGTGLGKCILLWNKHTQKYLPVASEGGHADFAIHTPLELELAIWIQKSKEHTCSVSWEDVLSGNGIRQMYQFFKAKASNFKEDVMEAQGPHPDEIFNSRHADEYAWDTFTLYSSLYARCAKNFALDALALSGIYIAGGIAAKNVPLFEQPCFVQEFINCGKQEQLLKDIPIYVIADYNISLYGAAAFFMYQRSL